MEALRERFPDLSGKTHILFVAGSHKTQRFPVTLALVHPLSTERVQRVPCSSRSWTWGNRGAE